MGFLPGLGTNGLFLDGVAGDSCVVVALDGLVHRPRPRGFLSVLRGSSARVVAVQEQAQGGEHGSEDLGGQAHLRLSACVVMTRSSALATGSPTASTM